MKPTFRDLIHVLGCMLVLILAGFAAAQAQPPRDDWPEPDLTPVKLLSSEEPSLDEQQAKRYRSFQVLPETGEHRIATFDKNLSEARVLDLRLLRGVEAVFVRDEVERHEETGVTWRGHVEGEHSTAILVAQGDEMSGYVTINRHKEDPNQPGDEGEDGDPLPYGDLETDVLSIDALGGGAVIVRRLNLKPLDALTCSTPDSPEDETGKSFSSVSQGLTKASSSSKCTTNVLVVYTPAAQSAHGNLPLLAQLAVDQANQAYGNSQVNNLRLNLMAARQVSYTETNTWTGGLPTDLVRLQAPADGFMDIVHTWRAELGADVVVLITGSLPPNLGGSATSIMANSGNSFAVVLWNVAVGDLVFSHEVGHLQGARHNPEVDPSTSPYQHGHGAHRPWYNYRTVMSYDCNNGCPRVAHFSNPDVKYNGRKTGDHNKRNNARVLRDTACTVSEFMPAPLLGWKFLWGSNNGAIDLWYFGPKDHLAVGDFDGDGADELLAANPDSHYSHLMDYNGSSWSTQWSNLGNGWIHWWSIGQADRFIAGDFVVGNGRDELLVTNAQSHYAHLMVYQGGSWSTVWSNLGSGAIDFWLLGANDRWVSASFEAGYPGDELLAINADSNYSHMMRYNGSSWTTVWSNLGNDLIAWWYLGPADRYLGGEFSPASAGAEFQGINPNGWSHTNNYPNPWNGIWSNGGSDWIHWWFIGAQDVYVKGNFLAGNSRDEILAIAPNNGWSQMVAYDGSNWQYQWGNSGSGSIGWWYIGAGDRCISGDFAAGDGRDELLCMQPANGWSHMHHYDP